MKTPCSRTLVFAALAITIPLFACGRKETYSPSCRSDTPLTSPWSGMALPTDEGRVCSSTSNRVEVQFTRGSAEDRMSSFETAVVASGFNKQECIGTRCVFTRGKDRLNLMRMDANKWKTIVMWL